MDKLVNKKVEVFNYVSRYAGVPYYFDTVKRREVYGIGTQIRTDTAFVSHKVEAGDTLDSLALTYYNNPTYWWAIAYFNGILDPFVNLQLNYSILKIPSISSISFKESYGG